MCERYSITLSQQDLEARFQAEVSPAYKPRYNAAPTQLLPVITAGSKGFSFFYWGLPPIFTKNKNISQKLINTKAETIALKASTKNLITQKRCIIPADGYFLWKALGKKTRVPYRFVVENEQTFAMAGIWDEYETMDGEQTYTFMLLTVPANDQVAEFSDRMPAILSKDAEKIWLDPTASLEQLVAVLKPYPTHQMSAYPVSPKINELENDSASLLRKTPPADQFGNYTLFG
ncbi:SOS response-associated peptidase [Penaeicola halotolerans]|uniref:SOS response-associated peptidase n=1 Tax=Penaeicola halotolerans TaxID=2793196 RepID=UPI001CF87CF3|nr:SOS response-associated peptidase [Penaeicola halotolerans]